MGVEKMVRRGRRRAARLMRASVMVERLGEEKISESPPFDMVRERTVVYEGRAKVQS